MLPELTTNRLVFREVRIEDGPELQSYETNPAHVRHQAVDPEEYADGRLRIQRYLEHRGTSSCRRLFVYVARNRQTNEIIGQFGLSRIHPGVASLGFGIASWHWGKGYGTEVARQALAYGFGGLRLHRICADVALENIASRRVVEKVGMIREDLMRETIWAQGRWWTEIKYVVCASDSISN